ncbi:MAG: putative MFS family arabinose efflux permease [Halioglobus sp.]|jgi:predicted MFS family arabinose efflux permease
MFKGFKTVWLLACANAIIMSASPMVLLIGSIIGAKLAPSEQLATLPIALMVIGTAIGVIPASRGMAKFGRKTTFLVFVSFGIATLLLSAKALAEQSFMVFCLSSAMLGFTNAAIYQLRFAAMESVPLAKGPTAASIIMCSGIVSAFLGPELAVLGRTLSKVEYQGSFWLATVSMLCGALILMFYRPAAQTVAPIRGEARPLRVMLQNPTLVLAISSAVAGFVIMSFVMTATPISMHLHQGHSLEDTKWVLQSHVAAMFLPSLFTVWLFKTLSIRGLMSAGLACFIATVAIGLVDATVMGYWGQLVMLGIGWNFLFVSGTALLPTAHEPGQQFRAPALHDSVVFTAQAIASLTAGLAITYMSWEGMLLMCCVPLAFIVVLMWRQHLNPPSGSEASL